MILPMINFSRSSVGCIRKSVHSKTEIPIVCSKRFLMSVKKFHDFNLPSSVIPKGKIRRDTVSVNYSGIIFTLTSGRKLKDDDFLFTNPAKSDSVKLKLLNGKHIEKKMRLCGLPLNNVASARENGFIQFSVHDSQIRSFRVGKDIIEKGNPKTKFGFFNKKMDKERVVKDFLTEEYRIRAMLNDTAVSPEEKEKIKIAFAEGYLNGRANSTPKKALGILRTLQQVLSIIVICVLIFMLSTNSVFKLGPQIAINPETIKVTFSDVKGVNDAKRELQEVVEFLKSPEKFTIVGGKLPKGILLVGPPGTGKTLLARALAGEAGVPFFHTCGAEFDEMLVGQGARRVRDLFKTAKEQAPCVIFIDEIDAVGCKRTNTLLHPHANQTVNQLLAEMDGFSPNEGVIVLGATNRRDDLDDALLRPGRFDLEVAVASPDYQGRKEIIALYLNKLKVGTDIDVDILARGTAGFTGADLESMINQAAIRAGADGANFVTMTYIEAARDKVLMGPEIKSRIPDEESNNITAYHEAGHALVAYYTEYSQPLHKVTIVARGNSLGHTAFIPEKDRYHVTKAQLLAQMDTMMGGRAAEDLIFGPDKITSGAASDLKNATHLATRMVRDWGMSEKVGQRFYQPKTESNDDIGQSAKDLLDQEIDALLFESYVRAKNVLTTYAKEHKLLADKLLQCETLDVEEIKKLLGEKNKN